VIKVNAGATGAIHRGRIPDSGRLTKGGTVGVLPAGKTAEQEKEKWGK